MRDLPVRKIPGFGRVTERCLEGLGVEVGLSEADELILDVRRYPHSPSGTIGHGPLVRLPKPVVRGTLVGVLADGSACSKAYLGIAETKVAPGKREERKSVGCER